VKNPTPTGGFLFKWDRKWAGKFWNTLMDKERIYTSDKGWRPRGGAPFWSVKMGSINVDHDMRDHWKVWAVGDACKTGRLSGEPRRRPAASEVQA
jgi:hypothetical protein